LKTSKTVLCFKKKKVLALKILYLTRKKCLAVKDHEWFLPVMGDVSGDWYAPAPPHENVDKSNGNPKS
jgi:hypothetical protein